MKTKVHTSKNISAPVDEVAQDTVFLEVQVQNVSAEPLFFEQLRFDAADGAVVLTTALPRQGVSLIRIDY